MNQTLIVGIELEGYYNKSAFAVKLPSGYGYRESAGQPLSKSWLATTDSSIKSRNASFSDGVPIEIVQIRRIGREAFFDSLEEFRKLFKPNKPLSECVVFNDSCGCHVHFSMNDYAYNRMVFEHVGALRELFFAKLKAVVSDEVYSQITKHYNRDYAKAIKKDNFNYVLKGGDRAELNFGSEYKGKGLEWRSFNLLGVTTWKEFFSVMNVMYDTLEEFVDKLHNYEVEYKNVVLPKAPKKKSRPQTLHFKIEKLNKFRRKA